ncbi:MAG: hypothetical protein ACLFUJ_15020, partial [Phycisphaerae bacterium]
NYVGRESRQTCQAATNRQQAEQQAEPSQPEPEPASPLHRMLSSEQREELAQDPAVQKIMELFQARGVDFSPQQPAPSAVPDDSLLDSSASAEALLADELDEEDDDE